MPATVTTGDLLSSLPALKEFASLDLPIKVGMKMRRILKAIQSEGDNANEMRTSIIKKYTKKDEAGEDVHPVDAEGKPVMDQVALEDPKAFKDDMEELFATEVKFEFDRLNPAELGERLTVKPAVLLALDWLFTE